MFPFQDFKKYFDRIGGIADGFALLGKKRLTQRTLVKLLKPPEDEIPRLLDALNDDLKTRSQDASSPSRIYRWVERLLKRAGFLYDALWSATFLGVNEAGFAKVADAFELAKYKGIFARPDDTRWWSSALASQLYQAVQSTGRRTVVACRQATARNQERAFQLLLLLQRGLSGNGSLS